MNRNDQPLVSIITPFLSTEKFFQESIESVISQTYTNWELLLVDDGSTDRSTEIAKSYAANFPGKIVYLEHPNHENRGISASRNLGIQMAKGVYIAFLDSDDIYLPKKLEDQVALFNEKPEAALLYSSTQYWYSWTGLPEDARKDWIWDRFGVKPNEVIKPPQLLITFLKDGGTLPCMGSILVRRDVIDAVDGWVNSFIHMYEDQVFFAKVAFNYPVYVVSGCWDRYRQHPDSICHKVERDNKAYIARHNYLAWLKDYLKKKGGHKNSTLWEAFQTAQKDYRFKYSPELRSFKKRIMWKIRKVFS